MPGEKCEEPAPQSGLANTRWRPVGIGDQSVTVPGQQREPWIVLEPRSKRVTGSGGCNRISGSYEADQDTLRFGRIVSTMMACPAMETETAFLRALNFNRARADSSWLVRGRYPVVEGDVARTHVRS